MASPSPFASLCTVLATRRGKTPTYRTAKPFSLVATRILYAPTRSPVTGSHPQSHGTLFSACIDDRLYKHQVQQPVPPAQSKRFSHILTSIVDRPARSPAPGGPPWPRGTLFSTCIDDPLYMYRRSSIQTPGTTTSPSRPVQTLFPRTHVPSTLASMLAGPRQPSTTTRHPVFLPV